MRLSSDECTTFIVVIRNASCKTRTAGVQNKASPGEQRQNAKKGCIYFSVQRAITFHPSCSPRYDLEDEIIVSNGPACNQISFEYNEQFEDANHQSTSNFESSRNATKIPKVAGCSSVRNLDAERKRSLFPQNRQHSPDSRLDLLDAFPEIATSSYPENFQRIFLQTYYLNVRFRANR